MTKEKLAFNITSVLQWGFPNANDAAHKEMEAVSYQIAQWLDELIEAKIKEHASQSG
jgi:hypothetical protein